ncbi:MAG: hypothetical protein IKY43_07555 [Bacteroidales bacterium]|nr:hypothetical protein [Bacteroidales bacterium]
MTMLKGRIKIKEKYYVRLAVVVVFFVIIGIVYANVLRNNSTIKEIEVDIDYDGKDTLVTSKSIEKLVEADVPNFRNFSADEMNRTDIENIVKKNPFIADVNVSIGISGKLHIEAEQRIPIVRVVQKNKEFYLDNNGYYMPISSVRNQRVIMASGYINGGITDSLHLHGKDTVNNDIYKVYMLANYLINDVKLKDMFDQIYVCKNKDIELVPKIGNHVVVLGNLENIDEKFENLFAVYSKGLMSLGWDAYRKINLKFKNQVVCTKN